MADDLSLFSLNARITAIEDNGGVSQGTMSAVNVIEDGNHKFVTDTQITTWDAKASTSVVTTSANGLMISTDKTKLDGISAGAEVNQNTFSIVKVGATNISATTKTDTVELVAGSNITLTPSGKTVTIANSYSYAHPTGDGNLHVPSTGTSSSGKFLKAGATAGSLSWANLTISDVSSLQTALDGKAATHSHPYLSSNGGTVTGDVTVTTAIYTTSIGLKDSTNSYPPALSRNATTNVTTVGATQYETWVASSVVPKWNYAGSNTTKFLTELDEGSGMGIDADMVDGKHVTDLAQLATANTFTHNNLFSAGIAAKTFIAMNDTVSSNYLAVRLEEVNADRYFLFGDAGAYTHIHSKANPEIVINSTNYKIWHEGNDGASSGLDADTVDGKHASELSARPFFHTYMGDGSDGAFNSTGNLTRNGDFYYTNFTLNAGHTWTSNGGITIIRCTGTATIAGTINASGNVISNSYFTRWDTSYFEDIIGIDESPYDRVFGGGSGGGGGGAGWCETATADEYMDGQYGAGVNIGDTSGGAPGTRGTSASIPGSTGGAGSAISSTAYSSVIKLLPRMPRGAFGGWGGDCQKSNSSPGEGGTGGGFVMIIANTINFTGTINVSGGNGSNAIRYDMSTTGAGGAGGGGGGGGGVVWLAAKNYTANTGTITTTGGSGGLKSAGGTAATSGGNGGAGGAGWYVRNNVLT